MRRAIIVGIAVAAMVPFLMNGATATGFKLPKFLMQPSGTVSADLTTNDSPAGLANPKPIPPTKKTVGCSDKSATNVRANQECTNQTAPGYAGRAQSQNETAVAVNPKNPQNILISQNDYRRGDGSCGVDFSFDGGKSWGSELAPIGFGRAIFKNGLRHYWTSGGDTSVGFDSTGEAYLMCQVFDRPFPTNDVGDNAAFGPSGFMILRSADGGASWSFPGDYVVTTKGAAHGGLGLLDKEYMAIDNNPVSPYRDRIYVSWTNYPADFSTAPIYLAYSTDFGATWHQSGEISGFSKDLCPVVFGSDPPGTCNNDQFSDPFVAPNGDLYVTFINANNCNGANCGTDPKDNHNQILIVKSTDGGKTFGDPVKVGDYYELPDCFTYTGDDNGRSCVVTTPAGNTSVFRAANYSSGVATDNETIEVDYASYINPHSNPKNDTGKGKCSANGFAGTGLPLYKGVGDVNGCNNDIVQSVSSDGGATFTGTTTPPSKLPSVNKEGSVLSDQWWQWTAKTPDNDVAVSFYDRQYGDDQSTGNMDISLAYEGAVTRVTDQSMPPSNEFPGTSGYSLFMGDYTGIAIGSDGMAHPAWADSRNPIYGFDPASADPRKLTFLGYGADTYTASIQLVA